MWIGCCEFTGRLNCWQLKIKFDRENLCYCRQEQNIQRRRGENKQRINVTICFYASELISLLTRRSWVTLFANHLRCVIVPIFHALIFDLYDFFHLQIRDKLDKFSLMRHTYAAHRLIPLISFSSWENMWKIEFQFRFYFRFSQSSNIVCAIIRCVFFMTSIERRCVLRANIYHKVIFTNSIRRDFLIQLIESIRNDVVFLSLTFQRTTESKMENVFCFFFISLIECVFFIVQCVLLLFLFNLILHFDF